MGHIEPGDTIPLWGCGPVSPFAVQSASQVPAKRVIAIDHFPYRLELAETFAAKMLIYEGSTAYDAADGMTTRNAQPAIGARLR